MILRHVAPHDYQPIIEVLNAWWGGRTMSDMLPKLFFIHFRETSFIAETAGEIDGFLIGFLSQSVAAEAYIHFVGVHPAARQRGIGRTLYTRFFSTVQQLGCKQVRCVTSPHNQQSIAYHQRMGFVAESGDAQVGAIPYWRDYDGAGEDRVVFVKQL